MGCRIQRTAVHYSRIPPFQLSQFEDRDRCLTPNAHALAYLAMWNTVLQSLVPVFLVIALGTGLRRYGFLPAGFFEQLNRLVFWVGLPALLYNEIAGAAIHGTDALRVTVLLTGVAAATIVLGALLARLLHYPTPSLRAFVQAAFRGNLAYVGLPVVVYALGADPALRTVAILAMAPAILFYNVAGVLVLMPLGSGSGASRVWRAVAAVARNPLILACAAGLAAAATGFKLPAGLNRTVETIGRLGLPGALLSLGAGLTLARVRGNFGRASLAAVLKVAAAPALGWLAAPLCGLHGDLRTLTLLYLATPVAVASYVMADQMGADRDLAGAAIVLSTLYAFPAMGVILLLNG